VLWFPNIDGLDRLRLLNLRSYQHPYIWKPFEQKLDCPPCVSLITVGLPVFGCAHTNSTGQSQHHTQTQRHCTYVTLVLNEASPRSRSNSRIFALSLSVIYGNAEKWSLPKNTTFYSEIQFFFKFKKFFNGLS